MLSAPKPRRSIFLFFRICAGLAWLAPNAIAGSTLLADTELREALRTEIAKSRSSIDAELYKLSDRELVRALAQAGRNGVRVRILLCPTQAGNHAAAAKISKAGGEVRWFPISRPNQIMHLKAALFEGNRRALSRVSSAVRKGLEWRLLAATAWYAALFF
jgi:phosphatidylserine/phosphatidylglycerophosphate/cardiolipin synthase-like enzyme